MTTLGWVSRLFDAMFWANDRVMEAFDAVDPAGRRYFGHVLAAERIWLTRLRGKDSGGQEIWPDLTESEMRRLADANRDEFRHYLATLSESDLERHVDYGNQTGRRFSTAVGDILIHIATHGAYHRGQVARELREAGLHPVNTDFITYARETDLG